MLRLEMRKEPSTIMLYLTPFLAAALTVVGGLVLFTLLNKDPLRAIGLIFITPLGSINSHGHPYGRLPSRYLRSGMVLRRCRPGGGELNGNWHSNAPWRKGLKVAYSPSMKQQQKRQQF